MSRKVYLSKKVPKKVPKILIVNSDKMDYSEVKLFIPKDSRGRATLDRPWYIWFNYRNPKTGKFDSSSKFNFKLGINRYKTVAQRKACGKNLVGAFTRLLKEGYNPYENTIPINNALTFEVTEVTFFEAITQALKDKKTTWAESTSASVDFRINKFIDFATTHKFIHNPARDIKRAHIVEFLKYIKRKGETATSVNNYRAAISGVFSQMVENSHIEHNFVKDIRKEKSNPVKNHPFTTAQISDIRNYLEVNDPYLLDYLRVLAYSFLRNREVLRLRVKDVDLTNRLLTDKTKTKAIEKVFIIDQLYEILVKMNLEKYDPNSFVFTPNGHPAYWEASEKSKTDHFGHRFKAVKRHFNLGREYGIYSFRHSFAVNIYEHFIASGLSQSEAISKMLPITRHDSVEGLKNYLREKRRMLPKDFSHTISIDL
ncbi:tyrosine-type recombinase/integrase [Candidatus Ulvibacter alkanivorans]|uniref:tyrosine-type recombinase/integrase n=1 Tax=Candidatus Ulvibacter alkanivorans TaxID=2267620 RepID=UPI000DF420A6|nr:tyrosine-type recombinase/integrase [Candidatus Ulvibacter alkanivorans]